MAQLTVHLFEVTSAAKGRHQFAREQKTWQHHQALYDALTAAGWKVNYGPEKQVIIGTSGSILKSTVNLRPPLPAA